MRFPYLLMNHFVNLSSIREPILRDIKIHLTFFCLLEKKDTPVIPLDTPVTLRIHLATPGPPLKIGGYT